MNSMSRRRFLGAGLGGGLVLNLGGGLLIPALAGQEDPVKQGKTMLILGGTKFLGPAVVDAAKQAGYEITLFNRGQTNPQLYPELEKIRGDRDKGELDGLKGRSFDVVVDNCGYVPGHVRATAEILSESGLYVFVSTVSVYSKEENPHRLEDSKLLTVAPEVVAEVKTIRESYKNYGAFKALCEQAAEAAIPGRTCNVRPGLIVGRGDSSDRFTYWPLRVRRGGEVLAPADPNAEVQVIDVRDLGDWIVRLGDAQQAGVYNAVGFDGRVTIEELLHGCKIVTGSNSSFTWVPEKFLQENKVRPYAELPLWLPKSMQGHYDVSKAIAAGLTFRPLADTILDTLAWFDQNRTADKMRAGMKPEREVELLAEWREQSGK